MKKIFKNGFRSFSATGFSAFLLLVFISPGCKKELPHAPKIIGDFNQVNLVANNNEYNAAHIDPLLLNAWGIAFSPTGTPWIGAQGGHVSTIYNSEGVIQSISPVTIPSPGGQREEIRQGLFLTAAIQILYFRTVKQPGFFLLEWMVSFRVGMAPPAERLY